MPDEPYTLGDLASLADVTPRTIRYYVAQGLLPSPEAAGPATRYGEGHLVRLRLIKRLQRDHLPLSEIRARLDRMGEDEIELLLNEASGPSMPPAPAETLAYVQELMTQAGVPPRAASPQASRSASERPATSRLRRMNVFEPRSPESFPLRSEPAAAPAHTPAPGPDAPPIAPLPASAPAPTPSLPVAPGSGRAPDRSTWERLAVTPDVEIHIRRPLDRLTNKKVDHLVRIARELFDEEP